MKTTLISIGAVVLVVGIIVTIFAVRWFTADARGAIGAREQIQSAPFRIQAYDRFFDQCAAVQALENNLRVVNEQLEAVDPDDRKERNRLSANKAGIEGQRGREIAEYNADSRKDYTVGQFKDSALPYTLNLQETTTSCGR